MQDQSALVQALTAVIAKQAQTIVARDRLLDIKQAELDTLHGKIEGNRGELASFRHGFNALEAIIREAAFAGSKRCQRYVGDCGFELANDPSGPWAREKSRGKHPFQW